MRKSLKVMVMAGLALGASWGGYSALAADDAVYELNPVVVTAQRASTEDLKTPATVQIITSEDIQKIGSSNVQQALAYSTGIITHGQGPRGISMGTMNDKAVIRGNETGTLVLVDGVPINQNGKYYLEGIPTDSVEKIEVVRGGGAVLYGSEASGGVINIITKGTRKNMVKAGLGNYGVQNYSGSVQAGKLGVTYTYDHTGNVDKISAPIHNSSRGIDGLYYNIVRGEQNHVDVRYDFTDHLYLTNSWGKEQSHYRQKYDGRAPYAAQKGKVTADRLYQWERNLTTLHYDDGDLKAYVFYNYSNYRSNASSISTMRRGRPLARWWTRNPSDSWSLQRDQTIGMDVSNRWKTNWGSFMLGYDFQRDMQKNDSHSAMSQEHHKYSRNMHAIYGQIAYDFTEKDTADFNFRETWTESDGAGNKYDKFTPEVTYTHNFNDKTSGYVKVGKSFRMPTFTQLYGGGNIVGVPGLKPETGDHYEMGFKKDIGKSAWRVSLFHYKVKDNIDANTDDYPDISYENSDVRNTGIELDWSRNQNQNLSYHAGITYSHPEKKEEGENNGNWHDYYGRFQFNGGLSYTTGKLTSAFEMSVLSARHRDATPYHAMKPQCFTDINFSYQANKECRLFLNIDNLFNRHDIISTSTSDFYDLGRNFMAGVEYTF